MEWEITHVAYFLMLIALGVKNMLLLRIILITAQTTFVIYGLASQHYSILLWNSIFFIINLIWIVLLLRGRRPANLPAEIAGLYERKFYPMTKREFLKFWQRGTRLKINEETIIREGEKQQELLLILQGTVVVLKNGKEIARLSKGDFIAEMSLLSGNPASADVMSEDPVLCMVWQKDVLHRLERLNNALWSQLQRILSHELIAKVAKTTSKI